MLRRFMPTSSTELRRKTARASLVNKTMVPVPVAAPGPAPARAALTTPPPSDPRERLHPSSPYDSPEIMTIPEHRTISEPDPEAPSATGDRRRWIALVVV